MAYIDVEVDIEIDDYLNEASTEALIDELADRKLDKDDALLLKSILSKYAGLDFLESIKSLSLTDVLKLEEFLETLKK